ncbi:hypothetical protein ACIPJK_23895 [Streptomyces roseus]|uniref:hypothetical protein n=1 Tax=Streptomyces roseus TaxID=66430 RepID=UPI00382D2F8C
MLVGQPAVDTSFEGFEDSRRIQILDALSEEEQAVTIARSRPGVASWSEAARVAAAPQPEAVRERVRRKVKRLADQPTGQETEDGTGSVR